MQAIRLLARRHHRRKLERTIRSKAVDPSLLACLVYDDSSERMSPTHANKKGTRYRYDVSQSLLSAVGRRRRRVHRSSAAISGSFAQVFRRQPDHWKPDRRPLPVQRRDNGTKSASATGGTIRPGVTR